jgi:hypothetical protein
MTRSKYWENVRRTVNLANAKDRTKAKAERHRLAIFSGRKARKMSKYVTVKDVRRYFKLGKQRMYVEARREKARSPNISIKNYVAMLEKIYAAESDLPTHFRGDVEPEMLP